MICSLRTLWGSTLQKNCLDEKGKLCLDKAGLLAYAHGEYYGLGKKLGTFGYSVRKKKNNKNIKKRKIELLKKILTAAVALGRML